MLGKTSKISRPATATSASASAVESECHIRKLFDSNLVRVLQDIFLMLDPTDLDNCKLVNSDWHSFLRSHVWGSRRCMEKLRPLRSVILKKNWLNSEPETTQRFPLALHYRRMSMVADAREIAVATGSARVLLWDRTVKGREEILFPFSEKTRGLDNFDLEAPGLALGKDVLFVYYPHDCSIYVFDRRNGYRVAHSVSHSSEGKFKKLLLTENSVLVLALDSMLKMYQYLEESKTLVFVRDLLGPNSGINSVASDGGKIYLGSSSQKSVAIYSAGSGMLEETLSTLDVAPDIMAVRHPNMVVAQRKGSPWILCVLGLETKFKMRIPYPYMAKDPPGVYLRDCLYDIQIHENKVVAASFTGNSLHLKKPAIYYHLFDLSACSRGSKHLFTCHGQHRRIRYPAFALEEDALIVGDENGDILVRSYWRVQKKKKLKGSTRHA